MSETRSILITGANRGIGLELTRQYAAEGWQVYACCRHPAQAEALQALAASGPVQVLALDVNHASQRASLADILQGQPIDILFNNAGVSGGWERQDFGHTDAESWEQTLRSNVIAPLKMMETLVEHVAASQLRIMANMSSRMGSIADNSSGGTYLYRSSKAALNMVCVSAAHDLARRGITVVALHPGWVRTDMGGDAATLSVADSAAALRRNLAGLTQADNGRFIDIDGSTLPW